jgi:hypothetical protein
MAEHRTLAPPPAAVRRTRGVVFVHSAPRALVPHIEWQLAATLGGAVDLEWTQQPVAPGHVRAEASWSGRPGTASRLVSGLRRWDRLRVEVTEDQSPGHEGERYCLTPDLGVYRAATGLHGDVVVSEDRLRGAMARAQSGAGSLQDEIALLLGAPWDAELEPFRCAGEGTPVRWLHQVG